MPFDRRGAGKGKPAFKKRDERGGARGQEDRGIAKPGRPSRPSDGPRTFDPTTHDERRPSRPPARAPRGDDRGLRQFTERRSLNTAIDAEEAKYYVVGRRAVMELMRDEERHGEIEKVYVEYGAQGHQISEILHHARKHKLTLGELDKRKFKELEQRVSSGTDPQGIIVLTAARKYQELEDVAVEKDGKKPFLIALDGVEDPHNMGAILRSAEAAGASAVLLPRRGAVLTPAVFKTSAGAAAHIPIVKYGNLEQTIRRMKEEFNIYCYGLAGEGERTIYDVDLTDGVCLVTGSEDKGLHRLIRERCDELVKIPLSGKTESLNASVATAVAVFEVVRQRLKT